MVQTLLLSLLLAPVFPTAQADSAYSSVEIRTLDREVVLTSAAVDIPAAQGYAHHASEIYVQFSWPRMGWIRGYRVELVDVTGAALPREFLHHAGIANLDRRALIDSRAERIIAAGTETEPVMLPAWMGLPVRQGERMVLYFATANSSGHDVHAAHLRVTFTWTDAGASNVRDAFPVYLGAHPSMSDSITFDVPPGRTVQSSDFILPISGSFRAMGGHLHDYGKEIRLEDAVTGEVLVRLEARYMTAGRISGVERTKFLLKRNGLHLEAGRRYRVVAVYDNPTCNVVRGAMGLVGGPFLPDDSSAWPAMDLRDEKLAADIASLTTADHSTAQGAHDDHASHEHHSSNSGGRDNVCGQSY